MKVLHVIPTLSSRFGGPVFILKAIIEAQRAIGVETSLLTTDIGLSESPAFKGDFENIVVPSGRFSPHYYAHAFRKTARAAISNSDVVHIHGLLNYPDLTAVLMSKRLSRPALLSPHGSLMKEKFAKKRLKKVVAYCVVVGRALRSVSGLHFATELERERSAWLAGRIRSEVIPFPVFPIERMPRKNACEHLGGLVPGVEDSRVILFLGRLSRFKGLDIVCDAFAEISRTFGNALLVIAGPDHDNLTRAIRTRCKKLRLEKKVVLTGPVDENMRVALLSVAEVFVIPALSENFCVAAAEAMSAGVPVVTTEDVGVASFVREFSAGRVVGRNGKDVAGAAMEILEDEKLRESMARGAIAAVAESFHPEKIAARLLNAYGRVITGKG